MILMIHVPKTAGTSLRLALQKVYGRRRTALDYGCDSRATSRLVRESLYVAPPPKARKLLLAALENSDHAVLAGHFPYRKYGWHFRSGEIVSFMREPVHRLASEYLHATRLQGYNAPFETFVEDPRRQNTQSRLLDGVPARAFVGITEKYRDSLELLGARLGVSLPVARRNVAPAGGASAFLSALAPETVARARELNAADCALYEERLAVLERQYARMVTA